eukprot:457070-Hanusia_phi.AAC.1
MTPSADARCTVARDPVSSLHLHETPVDHLLQQADSEQTKSDRQAEVRKTPQYQARSGRPTDNQKA